MADEPKPEGRQVREPDLKRPDEAIKDLEPDEQDADAIRGGDITVNCGTGMSKVI